MTQTKSRSRKAKKEEELSIDQSRAVLNFLYRRAAEPVWNVLEPLVNVMYGRVEEGKPAFIMKINSNGKKFTRTELTDFAQMYAALPARLVALAVQGYVDPQVMTVDDLASTIDGRLPVDDAARFGVSEGMTVHMGVGNGPMESSAGVREGFRQARRRIMDSCRHAGLKEEEILGYTLLNCDIDGPVVLQALEDDLPARIEGSRVIRWDSSVVTQGNLYVMAHAPRNYLKPFEWKATPGGLSNGVKGGTVSDARYVFRVRNTWSIARVCE